MYRLQKSGMEDLVAYYRHHKRSFPWRMSQDPYDVWLSEIMLQQTRTEAVISYFLRFKEEVPDIGTLAAIDDDRLLRLWEGLGYYSRARNLKKCAQMIEEGYGGKIPADHDVLLKLPGIGPYTAGAIMAIAFGQPYAAVDGNVLRVLSRYFGIREDIRQPKLRKQLEEAICAFYREHDIEDEQFIRDLTQAYMDLGATVCIPNGKPDCESCPLRMDCHTCQNGLWETIPFRSRNKERRILERTLFIVRSGETFLLAKRPARGLLAGMYEFIGADGKLDRDAAGNYLKDRGFDVLQMRRLPDARHVFTHIEWRMRAYEVSIGNWDLPLKENEALFAKEELQGLALPSAFRVYSEYYGLRGG
jgi:A/G-specific adenine glycosylase